MKKSFLVIAFLGAYAHVENQSPTTVFERSDSHSPEVTKRLEAEVGWKFGYRIPSLLVSKQGTILAFADRRQVSKEMKMPDGGIPTDVALRRSLDGGKTWQSEQILYPAKDCNYHSAMAVADAKSGRIYKFARRNPVAASSGLEGNDVKSWNSEFTYKQTLARGCGDYFVYSDDDGEHWSVPQSVDLPYPDDAHGCGLCNGVHGIQLDGGRMLILGKYTLGSSDKKPEAYTLVFYSDDGGRSWAKGCAVHTSDSNLEVVMAKVDEHTVLLNHRSFGSKKESDSARNSNLIGKDGEQLIDSYKNRLYASVCHAGMTSRVGTIITCKLFLSAPNASVSANSQHLLRQNLTLMLSRDGGKSWVQQEILDTDFSAYSDLQFAGDGTLLCLYESGKMVQSIKCLRIQTKD